MKAHFAELNYSMHFLKLEQALTTFRSGILLNANAISVIVLCCSIYDYQWKKNNVLKFISSMTKNWFQNLLIGLGAFLVEWSFFPENKRMIKNDPIVKKNECLERVLKNIGMISKRMEQNGNCWKRTVKIVNAFLLSRTCYKWECILNH